MRQLQRRLGEVAFAFHAAPVTPCQPTYLLTYQPTDVSVPRLAGFSLIT